MAEDWREDPFVDPDDPAALERAERRAEREAKRAAKEAKRKEKEAAKQPPPEPEPPAEPPKPARTPEQEFWDEDPEPAPEPPAAPEQKAPPEAAPGQPKATPEPAAAPEPKAAAEPKAAPAAAGSEPPSPKPAPAQGSAPAAKAPPQPEPRPEPDGERPPREAVGAAAAAAAGAAADPVPTPPPEPAIEQSWEKPPPSTPDDDIWGDEGDPSKRAEGGGGGGAPRASTGLRRYHPFRWAAIVIAFLILWFLYALFQPFHSDGDEKVQVTIPKGASVSEVGDILLEKGVIQDPIMPISGSTLFQIRTTIEGKRSELYAGNFTLTKDMSYGSAIDALSVPPAKRTLTVTIPEGYTRKQASQLVKEDGLPGNYMKKTVSSKFLDPAEYGGKNAKDLEGFLFPNTFEMKPKAPVADLVELQLKDFKRQIKKVNMKYAKSKNLTVYDVLTIASMIEDEGGLPKQRKLVASVIYNRLREGIPLGIDATIRFATGNYTKPLTESELAIDSPYNTRENQGLPPGPINSPGIAAIQAAAHPAETKYIYYVNKPNTCGVLAFSKTNEEFEADVAAYNKAREENGGNEPTTCGE